MTTIQVYLLAQRSKFIYHDEKILYFTFHFQGSKVFFVFELLFRIEILKVQNDYITFNISPLATKQTKRGIITITKTGTSIDFIHQCLNEVEEAVCEVQLYFDVKFKMLLKLCIQKRLRMSENYYDVKFMLLGFRNLVYKTTIKTKFYFSVAFRYY